jgi:hypothetical protein
VFFEPGPLERVSGPSWAGNRPKTPNRNYNFRSPILNEGKVMLCLFGALASAHEGDPAPEAPDCTRSGLARPRFGLDLASPGPDFIKGPIGASREDNIFYDSLGFWPVFGQTWPQNPSRTTGLVLQCRLHQKSAPQTNSKAISYGNGTDTANRALLKGR